LANHKSALKRARQNEVRRLRNKAVKTQVKGLVKDVRQAVETGQAEEAAQALALTVPMIDKAASKGVIHRRNASRKVSRLSKKVARLQKA